MLDVIQCDTCQHWKGDAEATAAPCVALWCAIDVYSHDAAGGHILRGEVWVDLDFHCSKWAGRPKAPLGTG